MAGRWGGRAEGEGRGLFGGTGPEVDIIKVNWGVNSAGFD